MGQLGTISDAYAVEYSNNQNNMFCKTREDKQLQFMQMFATPQKSHNCVDIENNGPAKGVCDSSNRTMTLLKIHEHYTIFLC